MREKYIESTSEEAPEVPGAQALLKGIDLLLAIGTASGPLKFSSIEKAVGIPRASLHRLLAALISRRLLHYDERTRMYHIGTGVLELSRRTLEQNPIIRAAKPELARLSRRLQKTVCITVLDGQETFVLDFDDMDSSYGRLVRLWPRARALDTAAGRAILSSMPKERAKLLVEGTEPNTDHSSLWADLAIAKALGYYVLPQEPASGRPSVAASILDASGFPVGALTCILDGEIAQSSTLHETGRIIAEGARRASGQVSFGFQTPPISPAPTTAKRTNVEILSTGRDFVGENPVWNERRNRLYWVDVLAPALRWWCPEDKTSGRIELPQIIGGIAFDKSDNIIGAGQGGIFHINPDTGCSTMLIDPETDRPDNRFNTAGVDAKGRYWVGSMAMNHQVGKGSLYSIDPDFSVCRHLESVSLPKNVAFSPDGTKLYLPDAAEGTILSCSVNQNTGALTERRVFLDKNVLPGMPNGVAVDIEGHLWVACSGAWCIRRFSPSGTLVEEIMLPIPMPTNCAFGGPDRSVLFITSTYIRVPAGLSARAPASGQLLAFQTGTQGQTAARFGQ